MFSRESIKGLDIKLDSWKLDITRSNLCIFLSSIIAVFQMLHVRSEEGSESFPDHTAQMQPNRDSSLKPLYTDLQGLQEESSGLRWQLSLRWRATAWPKSLPSPSSYLQAPVYLPCSLRALAAHFNTTQSRSQHPRTFKNASSRILVSRAFSLLRAPPSHSAIRVCVSRV